MGDSLAFLDADDAWAPEHLEDLSGLLEQFPEAGFAFSPMRVFGLKNEIWRPFPECPLVSQNVFLQLMRATSLLPSSAMVRREAFVATGGFDEIVELCRGRRVQVEDYDFFLRLSSQYPGVSSPRATALYRTYAGQSNVVRDRQMLLEFHYRMRLVRRLELMKGGHPLLAPAIDRMQRAWEQHLHEAWLAGKTAHLRDMVRWGRSQTPLQQSTKYYRWRALCPEWVFRFRQGRACSTTEPNQNSPKGGSPGL
jgi:GT2 family glycosyltransferase